LTEITASRISDWKAERLAATCPGTGAPYSAASINRPLQALSSLLHLAHEEWEVLPAVPRLRLEKEPQGRIRWLEPDEEARLIQACQGITRTPELAAIVVLALETGLRKGELLGLTWDRVDLSRGVLRLEITKSGKRREVPMRQAVYEAVLRHNLVRLLSGSPDGPKSHRLGGISTLRPKVVVGFITPAQGSIVRETAGADGTTGMKDEAGLRLWVLPLARD
jgi:integrase